MAGQNQEVPEENYQAEAQFPTNTSMWGSKGLQGVTPKAMYSHYGTVTE